MKAWLRDSTGVRTAVTHQGILLGRSSACTIVIDDPSISRRHCAVLAGEDALLVVPLGAGPVLVDGDVQTAPARLAHASCLALGRARFTVELEADPAPPWQISVGATRYPIHRPVFSVGGAADDHLQLAGWPARAVVVHAVERSLVIEALAACTIEGALREQDAYVAVPGARISHGGITLTLVEATDAAPTDATEALPVEVHLELVPSGAIARIRAARQVSVFLPQKRADLLAALLSPAAPARAGDWIDDEDLMARIWGAEGATRPQLNLLVHRTRQSLTEAGLAGPTLLQRVPGGGATRFQLAPGARVTIE